MAKLKHIPPATSFVCEDCGRLIRGFGGLADIRYPKGRRTGKARIVCGSCADKASGKRDERGFKMEVKNGNTKAN